MSMLVINEVLKRSITKGSTRLVLLVLAHNSDDTGDSWWSLAKLAKEANTTVSRLCKILKALEADGEISRARSNGGINRRSHYYLKKYASTVVDNSVTGDSIAGDSVLSDTVNGVYGNSVNSVTGDRRNKPTINHQVNHHNGRSKKSAIPADSRIKALINSFSEKYQNKCDRAYPTTAWAADSKSLKSLLTAGESPESITAAMDLYFADDFHSQIGFDIRKFCHAFSSLISRSNGNGRRAKFQSVPAPEGKYAKFNS